MLRFRSNYPLTTLIVLWAAVIFAARPPMPAPQFSLPDIAGQTVDLGEFRGQNVLLVFGTTHCPHCEDTIPVIEDFCVAAQGEIAVFFVAIRQEAAQLADFFADQTPSFGILLDDTGFVARGYKIKRVPTCVFIDDQGLVQYVGRVDENIFWRLLSGERPVYPDSPPPDIKASDRFKHRPDRDDAQPKHFIVELDEGPRFHKKLSKAAIKSRQKTFKKAAEAVGGRIIRNYGLLDNKIVIEIHHGNTDRLKEIPRFKSFREARRVHALLEDSAYQIYADYAWDNAITGQGVKVCVVDTGIDYTHPDLQNKVIAQYNVTNGTTDAMDDHGHGTHCAGIIASEGLVYRGVSHDVALMGVKVLDYTGAGYDYDVAAGINWCVEQGADVISLSLGEGLYSGTCDENLMAQAVNHAVDPCGVVVACASGNDGNPNGMVAPACASKAIAVGAVDKVDNIASYSDGGPELDLVAPGGDIIVGKNYAEIVSTFSTEVANNPFYCMYLIADECYDNYFVVDGTRYIRAEGTSMATPHVAAAAALLLEANPYLTPAELKTVLQENADDLGPLGWDNVFGWGRINIEKALDNIPPALGELNVTITEPNANDTFAVGQDFNLAASVDCFGGDGCGEVLVYAQYCEGLDCNDFADINSTTPVSTLDNNPNDLGILSGYTVDTDVPVIFDAQTTLDISEQAYTKSINPESSLVGSTLPSEYNTGDLEPRDGVGAIYGDAQEHYEFQIPSGVVKTMKVRMENYLVLNFYYPPFVGWYVYTSNPNGDNLHLVGDCIPPEGGGGETPPPDCWWISDDPNVIADLNPGGTNYIKLVSHDVDEFEWLTFNDIEVIIEYEPDPNNDDVHEYYVKFDIGDVNLADELTAARLKVNVTQAAPDCLADLYLVDNTLSAADPAQLLHEANAPAYSGLANPIKSFSCENTGIVSLNVKAAVDEALAAGQDSIAFQIAERNNDQLARIDANNGLVPPVLTISQKVLQPQAPQGQTPDANNGPRPLVYDTAIVKDVNDDTYVKYDNPGTVPVGAAFDSEYNTGDLEPNDGLGAIYGNAEKLYEFQIPAGQLRGVKVRMENYLVLNFYYPPYVGWYVYSSNANGDNLHIIGDCVPPEGGGGELPPPDCWFISEDPNVLADLDPGGTSYIKLVSHDVDEFEYLTFNDIEVIAEYQIDPDNDSINRYYLKFDVAGLPADADVDSATLNLYVAEPNDDAVAEVHLVKSTYDACTPAYMIYNAEDAPYSSLTNPIKTFACDSTGLRQVNVKPALEDALAAGVQDIAFLITEENENTLFAVDGSANPTPPSLNVYLKSDVSSGLVKWNILPAENGLFTIRVKATNNVGVVGLSDHLVVDVYDANLPVINSIDCMINSTWQDCRNAQYGDSLDKIRIDAADLQEQPTVWLTLRNVPDDYNFVDDQVTYSAGYFTYNTNLTIADSGQWQINVTAADSNDNTDVETIIWNIPWGRLDCNLISPLSDITAPKNSTFTVEAGVQCLDAECPDVNISLSLNVPKELKYDDSTAEDFGEIGSTDGYLAVKFSPLAYPAQLISARFYIWDETTYPFELNVWDDNGTDTLGIEDGSPGDMLITPMIVDPVVASSADPNMDPNVAWFDVDLSEHNITINSGDFYIGVRQIEEGKLNQLGFDMEGDSYYPFTRSWAYLPSEGWFNLDYYCRFCEFNPLVCELFCSLFPEDDICTGMYCGNLMIRAMVSEPGTYAGELPQTIGPAILYTTDDHPAPCTNPDMDPGQSCQASIDVHAVGPAGEYTRFYARAANNYSADSAGPVKVTITPPLTPCDAANLDAVYPVGYGDIRVLADQWLESTPPLFADINGDGDVNMKDFAKIAEYWLQSCN